MVEAVFRSAAPVLGFIYSMDAKEPYPIHFEIFAFPPGLYESSISQKQKRFIDNVTDAHFQNCTLSSYLLLMDNRSKGWTFSHFLPYTLRLWVGWFVLVCFSWLMSNICWSVLVISPVCLDVVFYLFFNGSFVRLKTEQTLSGIV